MAIKILTLDEAMEDNGVKILVYGEAGAGKTVLCATAGMSTILISAEAGLLSLKKFMKENPKIAKNIKVINIDSWKDLEETYDWLVESPQMADWVMLDSISEIAEQILKYEKDNNKDPRAAYGNLTDNMLEKMRQFRDLKGYNVLMTAKMGREVDSDTEKTRYVPMFPGRQVGPAIPYLMDEVFAMRVEENEDGTEYRVLQTTKDSHYVAKDRSGMLDDFEPPNIKKILKKINPDYIRLKKRPKIKEEEILDDKKDEPEQKTVVEEVKEKQDTKIDSEENNESESNQPEESKTVWSCSECDEDHNQVEMPSVCGIDDCESTDFYQED